MTCLFALAAGRSVLSCVLPLHELIEPARAAIFGFVLIKKRQPVLVEDLEELIPANLLERVFLITEVDAQEAALPAIRAGAADNGWSAVALLDPFPDFVVVGRSFRGAHDA